MMLPGTEGPFGLTIHRFRGSALEKVWPLVVLVGLTSLAVDFAFARATLDETWSLTPIPFTLIGVALSIFLGFRNNACYDRWWEARKLWGALVNNSRSFNQGLTVYARLPTAVRRELVYRQIAFVNALRMHLRGEPGVAPLRALLPEEEGEALVGVANRPLQVARRSAQRLRELYEAGHIEAWHLPALEERIVVNVDILGACERIKSTPLPLSYTILTHRIVGLYCLLLPFGLHGQIGFATPVVAMFVAYAFLGLDSIGSEIEDPFDGDINDLPLQALSRNIERDLRGALGETELPPVVQPINGVLH